jgi:hypothetical protein
MVNGGGYQKIKIRSTQIGKGGDVLLNPLQKQVFAGFIAPVVGSKKALN